MNWCGQKSSYICEACRLLDKSASVRKKAICCVAALCDALAASENTFSPDFKAADLMAALLKPLGLIMHPPDETTIATTEIERMVILHSPSQ